MAMMMQQERIKRQHKYYFTHQTIIVHNVVLI